MSVRSRVLEEGVSFCGAAFMRRYKIPQDAFRIQAARSEVAPRAAIPAVRGVPAVPARLGIGPGGIVPEVPAIPGTPRVKGTAGRPATPRTLFYDDALLPDDKKMPDPEDLVVEEPQPVPPVPLDAIAAVIGGTETPGQARAALAFLLRRIGY